MGLRIKLLHHVGVVIVCLGALIPLNVLYHQVRLSVKEVVDTESSFVAELQSFKGRIRSDHIALIESAKTPRVERSRRLFLTQTVLAPVLVTQNQQLRVKLINKEAFTAPIPPTTPQSTHYILIEE